MNRMTDQRLRTYCTVDFLACICVSCTVIRGGALLYCAVCSIIISRLETLLYPLAVAVDLF